MALSFWDTLLRYQGQILTLTGDARWRVRGLEKSSSCTSLSILNFIAIWPLLNYSKRTNRHTPGCKSNKMEDITSWIQSVWTPGLPLTAQLSPGILSQVLNLYLPSPSARASTQSTPLMIYSISCKTVRLKVWLMLRGTKRRFYFPVYAGLSVNTAESQQFANHTR